jgi:hypothetical protein
MGDGICEYTTSLSNQAPDVPEAGTTLPDVAQASLGSVRHSVSGMNLVKYDAACRALAEAKAVDEVKDIRDKAMGMELYAQQAKNLQMELDAAEIRLRAEHRLGELIEAQKETVGLAKGGQPYQSTGVKHTPVDKPTLASADIDKELAKRARKMARLSEAEFKDWPLLERAVEVKMSDQAEFVGWWEGTVTPNKGGDRQKGEKRGTALFVPKAEHRLGEMIEAQKPTLASVGIDKHLAKRARKPPRLLSMRSVLRTGRC